MGKVRVQMDNLPSRQQPVYEVAGLEKVLKGRRFAGAGKPSKRRLECFSVYAGPVYGYLNIVIQKFRQRQKKRFGQIVHICLYPLNALM